MYPARFHYEAPRTLEEACQMMAYYRDDAKVLSGGMSLIPLMKLRFASPPTIVDINGIRDLDYIEEAGGYLRIGALARNRDIDRSELVRARHPLMSSAAPLISDPVVRNRGTLVGNCCHADPQGDWATVMLCLDGDIVALSLQGERVIPIREFIVGPFQNSLRADEIAVEARIPGMTNYGRYRKIERKVGDFATVGVGVALTVQGGTVTRAGIGLTGVGPSNIKCDAAERMLLTGRYRYEGFLDSVARMAAATASPRTDHRGSADYKREMVSVFVRRALQEAEGIHPLSAPVDVGVSLAPPGYSSPVPVGAAGTPLPQAMRLSPFPSVLQGLKRTFRKHFY
ncbi:MAG TPA: xanthine dehydrogenase family protein subunit M [Actinomycetota bacterium]|nr:xanthine dehydrogenase family protein subunit M [Actinomycetota bacterium]